MSITKRPFNFFDRTGLVYGKLTVLKYSGFSEKHQRTMWECRCECGKICIVQGKLLGNETTRSCGCLKKICSRALDLSGKKFGTYTVIKFVDKNPNGNPASRFLCRCNCGVERVLTASHLNSGKIQSCGCLTNALISEKNSTHGDTQGGIRTKEYRTWKAIKDRCYLKSCKSYRIYGGLGISMCARWLNSFENFLSDVGRAPSKSSSIERKNNFGNYEKSNCIWSTPKLQARNRRTNIMLTHAGKTQCLLDWSVELKIKRWTLTRRIKSGRTIAQIKSEFDIP